MIVMEQGLTPLGNNRYRDVQGFIFVKIVKTDGSGFEYVYEEDVENFDHDAELQLEEA